MTVPPLPDVPCIRVRLSYTSVYSTKAGSRFYLSYGGSAPTGANCNTLASDIGSAWATNLAPVVTDHYSLTEVDVIDIATHSGASGSDSTTHAGGRTGVLLPDQVATNVEFDIARRYRGGKPRMFLPPGEQGDLATAATWTTAFVTAVNSGMAAFMAQIEALSIGAVGALAHVNLSFYNGFTNHTSTSGRERAVPTYRSTALHDPVTGYACKVELGSQRRRRVASGS